MWPAKGRERVKLIYLRPIYQYNRGQRQRQENDSIDQEHKPGNRIVQREKRTALFGKPLAEKDSHCLLCVLPDILSKTLPRSHSPALCITWYFVPNAATFTFPCSVYYLIFCPKRCHVHIPQPRWPTGSQKGLGCVSCGFIFRVHFHKS